MGEIAMIAGCLVSIAVALAPANALVARQFSADEEQLEQLVAPIALYADSLLMQVLIASTYPLEVVEAERWLSKNQSLSGPALEQELREFEWDPSVKSLCNAPDVVKLLSDHQDWMKDLGDAFLGQRAALLDAVQKMRTRARDAGHLQTTSEQTVSWSEDGLIVIDTPSPEVVYVPYYYPTSVYGGWYYPRWRYPALYPDPPSGSEGIGWRPPIYWGYAGWGHCNWAWGRSEVDIDVGRYNNYTVNTCVNATRYEGAAGSRTNWVHDPTHRRAVNYDDGDVARRYPSPAASNAVGAEHARGYDTGQRAERDRSANRPAAPSAADRNSMWSGGQNRGLDGAASRRGAASRGGGRR
jgi:uncharacterized protein DUF3300